MTKTNIFGRDGWIPKLLGNLKGKTYVITGANAVAGYEASKIFLSKLDTNIVLRASNFNYYN